MGTSWTLSHFEDKVCGKSCFQVFRTEALALEMLFNYFLENEKSEADREEGHKKESNYNESSSY